MDREVLIVWDADNIKTKNESIPTAFLGLQKKLIENNLILHKVFVCGYENSSGVRELMKNLENFGGFRCCPIFRGRNGDEADQKIIIEMAMFALENPQGAIVLISDDTDYVQFASDLYRKAFPLYWAVFNDENFPERILCAAKEIWGWKKLCTDDEPPPASQPIPSVPLWLDYLRRSVQENRSPSGMRYLFELALVVCDSSDADYKKIWESYREFEQSHLTEETNTYGVKRIQILFDRQLCQPLADVRASLLSYKSWEVEHHMLFPQPSCTISEKVHFHIMWDVTKCEVSKNVADKPKWRHIPSVLRQIVGEYFRLPEHSTGEIFVRLISRWAKDIDRELWRSQVECLYSGLGPKNSTTKLLVSCIAGALVGTSPSKTVLIILSDGKDHCQEDLSNLLLRLDMQGYKRLTIMPNSSQSEHWSSINAVVHDWKDVKRRVGITS